MTEEKARDPRNREEKLLDMAQQDESPHERDRAREILARHGLWPPPAKAEAVAAHPFGAHETVNEHVVFAFDAALGMAEIQIRDARTGEWHTIGVAKRARIPGPFGDAE